MGGPVRILLFRQCINMLTKIPRIFQPNFFCEKCDYNTSSKGDFKKHLQTKKHFFGICQHLSTQKLQKKTDDSETPNSSYDISCNDYIIHEESSDDNKKLQKLQIYTKKLQKTPKNSNEDQQTQDTLETYKFICECGKSYKERTGLWKHRKACKSENDVVQLTAMFLESMNKNHEFQKQIFDMMKDNVGVKNNHSNNVTTTNNNKFNLNFFLNETCKDAMNLSDFVNSLQITITDLENIGKLGYTEGISRIFTNGLKELDVSKRPIHCSDLKRETVYVKNENKWEKEADHLKKAIKQITNKNIRLIPKWKEENPGHQEYHNKKNDEYLKIMYESMGPTDADEENNYYKKILTNLAKETIIMKV